jgi:uncharacterized YccA/Bax inhibitor family protein
MPNPVLSPSHWQERSAESTPGWAAPAAAAGASGTRISDGPVSGWDAPAAPRLMTLGGTMLATAVLLVLILATGVVGWSQVSQTEVVVQTAQGPQTQINTDFPTWVFIPMLIGLGIAIFTAFKPMLARFTAPIYALCYGFALGAISQAFNLQYDGIVLQAVGATLGVFCVMLFLYATRIIKVTKRYIVGVIAAMGGIFLLYMVGFVASIFGADIAFWNEPTPLGIGISVVIVIVAALNLGIDFRFIETSVEQGSPKAMEWYGAFGLTVSLVWLYLEILRLLSLLRR